MRTKGLIAWLVGQDAYAVGGEYGILEGRILSLVHPVVMLALFAATGYAGYLGYQWRRVRTIQDEINELKKQVPAVAAEGQTMPSPIEGQIKALTEVHTYTHILMPKDLPTHATDLREQSIAPQ